MNSTQDKDFIKSVVYALDQSAIELEPELTQRLDKARRQAVTAMQNAADAEMLGRIQDKLNDSESLPADVQQKLNQIRQQAVEQAPNRKPLLETAQDIFNSLLNNTGLTAGMVATACLTLTVATLFYSSSDSPVISAMDEDLGLIASADELELYENLDFYLWLAENELLN